VATVDEALAAAAVVTWELDKPGRVATLQDVVVDPEQRGHGVGAALLRFVEAEALERGCRWLMLESGVRNARAHAFFERAGLEVVSHTFAKPLGGTL
jgi:GNAT superfamily N-acetyltransferase